ncbi:MAG: MBL fold metallo-hydrolase, partial [Acidimicrobiales bacterium]
MASTPAAPRPKRQEQEPASAEVTEVATGILRSQLPISLPGLGHVNCYFLQDERGVAIVDPGLPGPQSWKALVNRLKQAGYKPKHVHTVVVTHSHPDHFGGAGRLRDTYGAEVISHRSFRTWFDPAEDEVADDEA